MKKMIIIVSLLFMLTLSACSMDTLKMFFESRFDNTNSTDNSGEGTELVDTGGGTGYADITPAEAKKRLDSDKSIVLLDVRTQEEYDEKHIPGSILIPVDELEKRAELELPDKNAEIFVYCRSGRRSVTASEILVRLGYTGVYNLGGINDWPYEVE